MVCVSNERPHTSAAYRYSVNPSTASTFNTSPYFSDRTRPKRETSTLFNYCPALPGFPHASQWSSALWVKRLVWSTQRGCQCHLVHTALSHDIVVYFINPIQHVFQPVESFQNSNQLTRSWKGATRHHHLFWENKDTQPFISYWRGCHPVDMPFTHIINTCHVESLLQWTNRKY